MLKGLKDLNTMDVLRSVKLKVYSPSFIPLSLTTVQTKRTKQTFHSITPVLFPITVCIMSQWGKNSFLVKCVMKTTQRSLSKEGQIRLAGTESPSHAFKINSGY